MTQLHCSFCGKGQSEVAKLIAGPVAYICNECVVFCMEVLDADPAATSATEGQLLVRFPDASIHACEQQHAWIQFVQDEEELEWCAARSFVSSPTPLAVVAVRRHGTRAPVIGASIAETTVAEANARTVVDAHGGASRLKRRELDLTRTEKATSASRSPASLGFLSDQQITNFLSQQYRVPTINLDEYEVAAEVLQIVSLELCETHIVLPVSRAGRSLILAMADPTDEAAKDILRSATGLTIEPVIAGETAIRRAIDGYYKALRPTDAS